MRVRFLVACLGLAATAGLAGCGSSSSSSPTVSGPALDTSLSQIALQGIMEVTDSANFYVYFPGATSEALSNNIDNLQTLTLDTTGQTGKLTVTPASGTLPGIYSFNVSGTSAATTTALFNLMLYPHNNIKAAQPTVLTMTNVTQPDASHVTGTVTMPLRNGLELVLNSAVLVPTPGTSGIVVNSTSYSIPATGSAILTTNPDAVTISASITVTRNSVVPGSVVPGTVVGSDGFTHTQGVAMTLQAAAPSNGFSQQPYAEAVYIDNLANL